MVMAEEDIEPKEMDENTEFVKEKHDPKREYIFQKTGITKTGFIIIIAFLIIIFIGLVISGVFFGESAKSLWILFKFSSMWT